MWEGFAVKNSQIVTDFVFDQQFTLSVLNFKWAVGDGVQVLTFSA